MSRPSDRIGITHVWQTDDPENGYLTPERYQLHACQMCGGYGGLPGPLQSLRDPPEAVTCPRCKGAGVFMYDEDGLNPRPVWPVTACTQCGRTISPASVHPLCPLHLGSSRQAGRDLAEAGRQEAEGRVG